MRVLAIARYPVKSMQGEQLDAAPLETSGVSGDRRWGVFDQATATVLSAKREPALLAASAKWVDDGQRAVICLPDGTEVTAGTQAADTELSHWLGRPVCCRVSPKGEPAFVDLAPVHLLTTASVAAAIATYPEGQWDVHRFRPTIFVDTDTDEDLGFVEEAWIGETVTVGGATLQVLCATPRCSMVTRAQRNLHHDAGIEQAINRHNATNLGVYAIVTRPGLIAVGEPVTPPGLRSR